MHIGKVAIGLGIAVLLAGCQTTPVTPVDRLDETSSGQLIFESANTEEFRDSSGAPAESREAVNVSGKLDFPNLDDGGETVPAMILVHGSAGVDRNNQQWIKLLHDAGIATFQIDSFDGRGVSSTVGNQTKVRTTEMIVDAYAALELLATHPRIDEEKIGLMGFSKGGIVSQWSLSDRRRKREVTGDLMFALHMPLYPLCMDFEDFRPTGAPLYILAGEKDNWVPPDTCVSFVDELAATGYPAEVKIIENAHHEFDRPEAGVHVVEGAWSALECDFVMRPKGSGPLDSYERNSGLPAYTIEEEDAVLPTCATKLSEVKVGADSQTRDAAFSAGLSFIKSQLLD